MPLPGTVPGSFYCPNSTRVGRGLSVWGLILLQEEGLRYALKVVTLSCCAFPLGSPDHPSDVQLNVASHVSQDVGHLLRCNTHAKYIKMQWFRKQHGGHRAPGELVPWQLSEFNPPPKLACACAFMKRHCTKIHKHNEFSILLTPPLSNHPLTSTKTINLANQRRSFRRCGIFKKKKIIVPANNL